jgi:hypothetical protein
METAMRHHTTLSSDERPVRRARRGAPARRWRVLHLALVGVLLLVVATVVPALAGSSGPRDPSAARKALARYENVDVALADGYVEKPINGVRCVAVPYDGAMGIHYLNPGLIDGVIDPLKPEVLLYEQTRRGLTLVGVEYFEPDLGQPRPTVFGRPLEGPMPGHEPGMPVHYDLHVWLWKRNPSGMFATYNPDVYC